MCVSSVPNGLLGHDQNQFPPKLNLHHIQNIICKYYYSNAARASQFGEEWLLHCHPHQQPPHPSSRGRGGSLCPIVSTSQINTLQSSPDLDYCGFSNLSFGRNWEQPTEKKKKCNKQKCGSLRNVSDLSFLKFSGCANTVRKPFPWPCVLMPCISLVWVAKCSIIPRMLFGLY